MKIDNATFRKLVRRIETLEGMLAAHKVAKADDLPERLAALRRKRRLAERAKLAGKKVKEAQTLILKARPSLPCRSLLRPPCSAQCSPVSFSFLPIDFSLVIELLQLNQFGPFLFAG